MKKLFMLLVCAAFWFSGVVSAQTILDADQPGLAERIPGIRVNNVQRVAGREGKVFRFNGEDSYIHLPYAQVINPETGTIEMWVKSPDVVKKPLPIRMLFSAYYYHTEGRGRFFLSEIHTPGLSKVQISSMYRRDSIDPKLGKYEDYRINFFPEQHGWQAKDWHFLAWTWGSGKFKFYVDGVLQEATDFPHPLPESNGLFSIGASYQGLNNFRGYIGDIVITKNERSADEILNDFKFGFDPDRESSSEGAGDDSDRQSLQAVFFAEPPTIDGGVADAAWNDASLATPFHITKSGGPSPKDTRAYIGYDASNLYVAFKCHEPNMGGRVPGPEGGKPFFADAVEFFVAPFGADEEKYFQIAVDYTGKAVATAYIEGTGTDRQYDESWNPEIEIALTRAEADFWAVEMAIPIASLRVDGQTDFASDWGISFARTMMNPKVFTAWSRDSRSYHDLKRFGILKQIGDKLANSYSAVVNAFEIKNLETLESVLEMQVTSRADEPIDLVVELNVMDADRETVGALEEQVSLAAGETADLSLPFNLSQRGNLNYRVDIIDAGKKLLLWSSGNRFTTVPDEVEFLLDAPHYRDTIFSGIGDQFVAGTLRLNLPVSLAESVTGSLALQDPDGNAIHTAVVEGDASFAFSIDLPESSPFGEYTLVYTGQSPDSRSLEAKKTVRYLPSIPGTVATDEEKFITVDGERFFPLGTPDLRIAIERGWMTLEDSQRSGFNITATHLAEIDAFTEKYADYGYKIVAYIDPYYKVVYDQDWPRLHEIMQTAPMKNPSLFSYQSGDEILGRVSKDTMIKAYEIISEADPYHAVSFYENHTEFVIDSFEAADFGQFDYYPIVGQVEVINIYKKIRDQYAVPNSKPIVYVPEIFSAQKWDEAAVIPTFYEQIEICAFLGITAKARGIIWWRVHYAEKDAFDWAMRTAEKIHAIKPILLTDDLEVEAKSLTPGVCVLSKQHDGKYYVITANANEAGAESVRIELPPDWNAGSVREFYSDRSVDLADGAIVDRFSGPYGVKVYEVTASEPE